MDLGFQSLDPDPTQCADTQCLGHEETCCTLSLIPWEPQLAQVLPQRSVATMEKHFGSASSLPPHQKSSGVMGTAPGHYLQ